MLAPVSISELMECAGTLFHEYLLRFHLGQSTGLLQQHRNSEGTGGWYGTTDSGCA